MTALAIAIPAPKPILAIPTPEDVLSALTTAGFRVFVFRNKLCMNMMRSPDEGSFLYARDLYLRLPYRKRVLKAYCRAQGHSFD